MKKLLFSIQGSAKEPYRVTFHKNGLNLSAFCTCPAGDNGQYCKHRLNILAGNTEGIVSGNETDVDIVASWLLGTDVETALKAVMEAEEKYDAAKRELSAAKKRLALTFRD